MALMLTSSMNSTTFIFAKPFPFSTFNSNSSNLIFCKLCRSTSFIAPYYWATLFLAGLALIIIGQDITAFVTYFGFKGQD